IRGTAQHIADKYSQLARDAQASGDPVSAENYLQHAEHYYRLIAAAQEQFRQQYGQFQRPFDEDGEDGDDDGGPGFGHPGERNGAADDYGDPGYGPAPYANGGGERGGPAPARFDRNGGGDRGNGGDRPNGGDRNGRYDRNGDRFDRNGGGDRAPYERGERQDFRNGQDRGGQDRGGQDRGAQERGGYDRTGQERPMPDRERQPDRDRPDRNGGERGDRNFDRGDRRERFGRGERDGRPENGRNEGRRDFGGRPDRGPMPPRGDQPRYAGQEDEGSEDAGLPAFLVNPVRPPISVPADEAAGQAPALPGFGGEEEHRVEGEMQLNGVRPRRRRSRRVEEAGDAAPESEAPEKPAE
ncbi:MAG: DUF4167 domain-containing protein, partial [Methylobacteriaceae bacterium]|nr:DUF4167 domain-containing protein [Methylobacteriaceae bacterium]